MLNNLTNKINLYKQKQLTNRITAKKMIKVDFYKNLNNFVGYLKRNINAILLDSEGVL